jgi:hypothetical protein
MFTTTTTFNVTIEAIDNRTGKTTDKVSNPTAETIVDGYISTKRLLEQAKYQANFQNTDAGMRHTVKLGHMTYYIYS